MRAVIYIRKSKESKYSKNSVSLETQLNLCRGYASMRGMEIVDVIEDDGVSGYKTDTRKGWVAMMGCLRDGKADHVIVYSLSRFARNTVATLTALGEFSKKGIGFHSVTDSLDTTSAVGKMFLTILSAFNQYERDITGERTKDALQRIRDNGGAMANAPYGYKKSGKRLVVDPAEQDIIAVIKEMHGNGAGLSAIREYLQESGHKSRSGVWHNRTIYNIIKRNT